MQTSYPIIDADEHVLEKDAELGAFLEAGSGWIPYMMDRMNEEFEKPFGKQVAIKRKPGDYIRSGQV